MKKDKIFIHMKNKSKKFITSALPYVNNQPHLGNVIGAILSGDVYTRFCKKYGHEAYYISGTDDHGTPIEMEALKSKQTPLEVVLKYREIHKKVYSFFNIKFDVFGHTHCEDQENLLHEVFYRSLDYFKSDFVSQFYCEKCEQFLADRFIVGRCPYCLNCEANGDQCDSCGKYLTSTEINEPKCKMCLTPAKCKETEHLFLQLNKLSSDISKIDSSKWSDTARNIFNDWKGKEMHPRCMTRDLKFNWGVSVPIKDFENKVFYVWFDGLVGYLTFLNKIKGFDWLNEADFVQFMGKDNVPFHSIIFPAFMEAVKQSVHRDKYKTAENIHTLKGLKSEMKKLRDSFTLEKDIFVEKTKSQDLVEKLIDCDLDKTLKLEFTNSKFDPKVTNSFKDCKFNYNQIICASNYLTFNGQKFSKSKKIGIFGLDLIENDVGDVDKWRFYLLRRRPENKDSDFVISEFIELIRTELIGTFGNYINRVLKYIKLKGIVVSKELENIKIIQNFDYEFKQEIVKNNIDNEDSYFNFIKSSSFIYHEYLVEMENINLRNGFDCVFRMASLGNKFLQEFQLKKEEMPHGYALGYSVVVYLAHMAAPFLPEISSKIYNLTGIAEDCEFPERFEIVKEYKKIPELIEPVIKPFTKEQILNLKNFDVQKKNKK